VAWSTSIVDVNAGQLLDVIEGRSAVEACRWLSQRDQGWLDAIEFAVLDLSDEMQVLGFELSYASFTRASRIRLPSASPGC